MSQMVLQRLIFPSPDAPDVMALYAEGNPGRTRETFGRKNPGEVIQLPGTQNPMQILSRHRYLVPAGQRTSLATYFNAFPAGYWAAHTSLTQLQLRVSVRGVGSVLVYRSNAKGNCFRIASRSFNAEHEQVVEFNLPLNTFGDGGWYWFDVLATTEDVIIEGAKWVTDWQAPRPDGKATIAITTFNRPVDCLEMLRELGSDDNLSEVVDQVLVMDQGDRKVSDETDFEAVRDGFPVALRIIEQPNLGGSGGFSRGMFEAVQSGSEYVLLLDDDVAIEREGIRRAVTFARCTRQPTVVGGHMFSMFERTKLHAYAEVLNRRMLWWTVAPGTKNDHDFSAESLRATAWLHERADADYNGWWMCLIPTALVRKIGLSLPFFIKWDDSEYGLRAAAAGVKTVTLPGMALWHVPWAAKDDSLDWQAYFHQRNRLIAALLHSNDPHGNQALGFSLAATIKHILSSQYSVAHLRNRAMEDVLDGPSALHESLLSAAAMVREERSQFSDAQIHPSRADFPEPSGGKLSGVTVRQTAASGRISPKKIITAVRGLTHQLRTVKPESRRIPQKLVTFPSQRWWTLIDLDSAVVTTSDGSGFSLYQRDRELAARQLRQTLRLHQRMRQQWSELARTYRKQLPQITGPQAWAETFKADYQPDKW